MEETECSAVAAAGRLGNEIQRWSDAEVETHEERREPSTGKDRRLKSIYTLLDGSSPKLFGWQDY